MPITIEHVVKPRIIMLESHIELMYMVSCISFLFLPQYKRTNAFLLFLQVYAPLYAATPRFTRDLMHYRSSHPTCRHITGSMPQMRRCTDEPSIAYVQLLAYKLCYSGFCSVIGCSALEWIHLSVYAVPHRNIADLGDFDCDFKEDLQKNGVVVLFFYIIYCQYRPKQPYHQNYVK